VRDQLADRVEYIIGDAVLGGGKLQSANLLDELA
jgi:hypothetical protein